MILNGVKIAKRGHPGTLQAKTWVLVKSGFESWINSLFAAMADDVENYDGEKPIVRVR